MQSQKKKIGHTINKCFTLKDNCQPPKSLKSESLTSAKAGLVHSPDPEFQPFLMKDFVFDREGP